MSRVGRQPIPIPSGVTVSVSPGLVTVTGPKGTLHQQVDTHLSVEVTDGVVHVSPLSEGRKYRALHGLTRTLVSNMVAGVSQGFQKSVELVGVGYRVQQSGKGATFQIGYAKPAEVEPPTGIALVVEGANRVHVQGPDKQQVGAVAARLRSIRPPNAYSGKGIRYVGEAVRLKPGKAASRSK